MAMPVEQAGRRSRARQARRPKPSSPGRPWRSAGGGSKRGWGRAVEAVSVARDDRARRHHAARAGRARHRRQGRHAAGRDRRGARRQRARCCPSSRPTTARSSAARRAAPTLGGLVAANLSGPRRIVAGACRDSLIGVRFVNGRGEAIKSGGRVMKNVTGYDLVKLMAGAHGTLGILTEVTFKVLPKPEASADARLVRASTTPTAVALMSAGARQPLRGLGGGPSCPARGGTPAQTLLRLENFRESCAYRPASWPAPLKRFGPAERLDQAALDGSVGGYSRRGAALSASRRRGLAALGGAVQGGWRSPPPRSQARRRSVFYDWGGGLVWVLAPETLAAAAQRSAPRRRLTAATRRCCAPAPTAPRRACPGAWRGPARGADHDGSRRRSIPPTSSIPAGWDRQRPHPPAGHRAKRDADQFLARAACRSADARIREDPAHLRALRLLHRDLPDLCAPRRRARFAARAHLSDQGHAGRRQAGDGGGRQACRPLPVLPRPA